MTPERWDKVGEIFNSVLEKGPGEVDDFLAERCGDDAELRAEVESLLEAERGAGKFISQPVAGNFVSDLADHLSALSPGRKLGHYEIGESIGAGGMGEVYLATDTKLGRKVAIKTLPPSFSNEPSFLRRFRNEAQAAAKITHPNVATVYSVEEIDGINFLTMEYIEGNTLDKLIPDSGLDLKTFLAWFEPITQALAAAHKRGVIHRDIKPGNIMISAEGVPKVLDFGLAQIESTLVGRASLAGDITAPGQIIGTPSYMSPEQAEGAEVDARSDIFSLGTVMYEALTGKRPFRGPSRGSIVKAVLLSEPEPIANSRSDLPHPLTQMLSKCLQKSPGARIQSMDDICSLLRALRSASDGGLTSDSFARRFYRESMAPSRSWLLPTGLLAIVLAVGAWWYFFPATAGERFPIRFDRMTMTRFSDADNVGYAQITPDGRSVAFATAEPDGTRALWIRRIDDRNPLQLIPPHRLQFWGGLAVSNDGGQVYYITAGRTASFGTLYRVSSLGGPPRKLVEPVNDVGGLSPDGSKILLVRYGEPTRILSVNSADGSDERTILEGPVENPRSASFRDPHFSPDGRKVFYIRNENQEGVEHWSLESVEVDGGKLQKIYTQPARISELAVLPDASGLIYTGVDVTSNLQQVFHISLRDGVRTRVTNDLNFYFGVNIDSSGKTILVSQRADESQIWLGKASDPSSLTPTIQEPLPYRNVDWTPDGKLVYDGYDNNVPQIWLSDPDGKNRQKLTSSELGNFEPRVSPDGRYIVFTSKRNELRQVWRMNRDGGEQTLLANAPGVTQAPRFSGDGQFVVFEWFKDNRRVIGRVPIGGGAVEEYLKPDDIPANNAFYWAFSPDGRSIAHSIWVPNEQQMKIAIRPIDAVAPEKILDIWPSVVFKWSPDGKGLVYRERHSGDQPENVILEADVTTGKTRALFSAGTDQVVDFTYSRDMKLAAAVRGRNSSNAVLLRAADPSPQK